MSRSLPDRCGYTWPVDHGIDDDPRQQSCCWRKTVSSEHDRCVWHVDPDEVTKSAQALQFAHAPPDTLAPAPPETVQWRRYTELLDGANLAGVELGDEVSFENVALRDSDLSDANLQEADLSYANLQGADLSIANLSKADLFNADLQGADLSIANLSKADLEIANLSKADLRRANLFRANLSGANLQGADLSGANIIEVEANADFREANLTAGNLFRADLTGADLRKANLTTANIVSADLTDADFKQTNLKDANIKNIINDSVSAMMTGIRLYEGGKNPFSTAIKNHLEPLRTMAFESPYIHAIIFIIIIGILLVLDSIFYLTIGIAWQIWATLWSSVVDSLDNIQRANNNVEAFSYAVAAGIFAIISIPFLIIILPALLIGWVMNVFQKLYSRRSVM